MMTNAQLSLWDNEPLERGYHSLSDLKLIDARNYFTEALRCSYGEKESIFVAIAACDYWLPRVHSTTTLASSAITILLSDFRQFPFAPFLNGLKKSLLDYIVEIFSQQTSFNWDEMEITFDLLLEMKNYNKAEHFISNMMAKNFEKWYLLYFLAQAQWLGGNKITSTENYIIALLHYPEKAVLNRIEHKEIQSIVIHHGATIAPAYCYLLGFIPFIPDTNSIQLNDAAHASAIKCMYLIREANNAILNDDLQSSIHYRKQLKSENAELYDLFFEMLKQKKIMQK